MLTKGTLVKIVQKSGNHWNKSAMDKFKGRWGIVHRIYVDISGRHWYELKMLDIINSSIDTSDIQLWKWKESDFEFTEPHCWYCGKLSTEIEKGTDNNICSSNHLELYSGDLTLIKNIAETSQILSEEEKNIILTGLENLEVCKVCGNPILNVIYYTTEGHPVCRKCRDNYYMCENCNVLIPRDSTFYSGPNGSICCSIECQEEYDPYDFSQELAYNAKPPAKFLGSTKADELYLGVEVEVDGEQDEEYKESCIYALSKTTGDVYCKHDGSLNGGFEFVTHPATLEYHKKTLVYDKLIKICEQWGFGATENTTGLHIHVNKNFFGNNREALKNAIKLEIFFERFWENMLTFARREPARAERWAKRRYFIDREAYEKMSEEDTSRFSDELYEDRYTAINVTNAPTIEFRLFNGTTNREIIFATLEFVHYICHYVKNKSIEDMKEVSWKEIFEEVETNKDYKVLKQYMKYRRIDSSPVAA